MMQCPFCRHDKIHKHGQTSKDTPRRYCPNCRKTFTETFETLYYRRKTTREKIEMVLPAHSENRSLRGISRTTKLGDNTVESLIRAASIKGQMIHNHRIEKIETQKIASNEFWSFVEKRCGNEALTEAVPVDF